jgi:preprotein translocase subunit SecE
VARDRQRAKQRKARRSGRPQGRGPAPSQPRRADLPGELEHASGEVDEFEAALVSGADGQTVDDEDDLETDRAASDTDDDFDDAVRADDAPSDLETDRSADEDRSALLGPADEDDFDDDRAAAAADRSVDDDDFDDRSRVADDEEDDFDDATLEREAVGSAPAARREAAPGAPTRKGRGRLIGFLRASWAELQRVQWPDRRQVAQATGVVIGFVIVAGLYLGVADWVAKQIVNAII